MWMKVVLTVYLAVDIGYAVAMIGREREAFTAGPTFIASFVVLFLIYGLWKWA